MSVIIKEEKIQMITRYKIFEYWKDKCITNDGEVEEEGQIAYDKSICVIGDWGEPKCWACGSWISTPVEGTKDYKTIWNYSNQGLEKCHIIAKQFGGENTPENLFLLCTRCHRLSPDTKNKKRFYTWVYKERTEGASWLKEITDGLIKYSKEVTGYEFEDLSIKIDPKNPINIKEIVEKCGFHGREISITSLVFEVLEEFKRMLQDLEKLAETIRTFDGTSRKGPIASVSEIFAEVADAYGGCVADFGDDAAAIDIGNGDVILFAADGIWGRLIEKSPWWAGFTAVLVNVNDIIAMGGKPLAMVDIVSSSDPETFKEIFKGMTEGIKKFKVPVVGGHTHPEGEKSLSVAIIGIAKKDQIIRSDSAKPGDLVIYAIDLDGKTGPNSLYSFESVSSKTPESLKKMYEAPQILGQKQLVTAGKDISNPGIIGTLGMLCETSCVGAHVRLNDIVFPEKFSSEITLERWLLMHPGTGFVFTATPEKAEESLLILEKGGMTAAVCGEITADRKVVIDDGEKTAVVFDFEKEGITGIKKK